MVRSKARENKEKLALKLIRRDASREHDVMDYYDAYGVINDHIQRLAVPPIIVSEGANTMDIGRVVIQIEEPRTRLDAGTWGTMGVGCGYMIAAALTSPERPIIGLEGDSAFGFSGMDVETICRYKLPVVIIVFNNNGIYGGAYEAHASSAFPNDPCPTAFLSNCRYDQMMVALGGDGYYASTCSELDQHLQSAFTNRRPALINIEIDPYCGEETGSMKKK